MPSVLMAGASGYIGGPFLVWFKSQYPEYKITATSRSAENTKLLRDFGVDVIETTGFPDFQKAASEADVVFNFTSAANPPLIQAIIAGLKERSEKTKKRPYFFHVSGATSILDPTPFEQSKVISDTDEAKLRAIPLSNFTHASDVEIQSADEAGYLWSYIFSLPMVYGQAKAPIGRSDSAGWRGFMLPDILARREVAHVGDGSYSWDSVHIDDLIDLLALITQQALSNEAKSANPYDRFFFAGNDKPTTLKAILERIASVLYAEGLVDSAQPVTRSLQEAPGIWYTAGNIRGSADRGAALGWKPSRPSILEGLEDEIRAAVKAD